MCIYCPHDRVSQRDFLAQLIIIAMSLRVFSLADNSSLPQGVSVKERRQNLFEFLQEVMIFGSILRLASESTIYRFSNDVQVRCIIELCIN